MTLFKNLWVRFSTLLIISTQAYAEPLTEFLPLPGNLLFVDFNSHVKARDAKHELSYRAIDLDDIYSEGSVLYFTEYSRYIRSDFAYGLRSRKLFDCKSGDSFVEETKVFSFLNEQYIEFDEEASAMLYSLVDGEYSNLKAIMSLTCKSWDVLTQVNNRMVFATALRAAHARINAYLIKKYSGNSNGMSELITILGVKYFANQSDEDLKPVPTQFFTNFHVEQCGDEEKCWDDAWRLVQMLLAIQCALNDVNIEPEISSCPSG